MPGQGTVSIHAHQKPLGHKEIPVADIAATAVGFADATIPIVIPDDATIAYIQAEGGDVKWKDDGVDPTATEGHLLIDTAVLEYCGKMDQIKFIAAAGTPKLNIAFYRG